MLDAFIIEELKRREERRRQEAERPVLRLPVPDDRPRSDAPYHDEDDDSPDGGRERDRDRGVVIIDL